MTLPRTRRADSTIAGPAPFYVIPKRLLRMVRESRTNQWVRRPFISLQTAVVLIIHWAVTLEAAPAFRAKVVLFMTVMAHVRACHAHAPVGTVPRHVTSPAANERVADELIPVGDPLALARLIRLGHLRVAIHGMHEEAVARFSSPAARANTVRPAAVYEFVTLVAEVRAPFTDCLAGVEKFARVALEEVLRDGPIALGKGAHRPGR